MTTTPYPNPQFIFQQQYEAVRRDEVVGVLLALFLGSFGIHHFYVGRTGLGILYCCFFWSGIPAILGFFECFFMPGRVRRYNAMQAAGIAAALGIPIPWYQPGPAPVYGGAAPVTVPALAQTPVPGETTLVVCSHCRQTNPLGSRFCAGCGTSLV